MSLRCTSLALSPLKKKSSSEVEETPNRGRRAAQVVKRTHKAPKTVSLKKELQSDNTNTQEKPQTDEQNLAQKEQTEEEQEQITPEKDESPTDLENIWQEIAKSVKDDGPRINTAMQNANPKQIDTHTIQIDITAEIQKDLYEKFEEKILRVLQRKLKNNTLSFSFNLVESEAENNRPLTDAEKYQKLIKQNPVLEKLREKFNLDLKK